MDLGFETAGNAILVCYDKTPVLVTDPWTTGSAYFGSWGLSHELPLPVADGIARAEYVWISHGHPDHLSARSLDKLAGKKILLADHVGGLIAQGLRERGFDVWVMSDRKWHQLSPRIRVLAIADYLQDSVLLIDIGGKLIVNLNDAGDHGWAQFVKKIIKGYDISFLLRLTGFGDTDMINIWREDGTFVQPPAALKRPVGRTIARMTREWGAKYFIPFSSMHIYERADSLWASKYRTSLEDYSVGFNSSRSELLPAFIRYDVQKEAWYPLCPKPREVMARDPSEFGDNWTDHLEDEDKKKVTAYFKAVPKLGEYLDFVAVRVGGQDHVVELATKGFKRGITFEAPRNSLMISIENEIFDDLLIGNFMKTILHGEFSYRPLYPYIGEFLTKYADNGRAKTPEELHAYFAQYRRRAPLEYLRHRIERATIEAIRYRLEVGSAGYRVAAWTYHRLRNPRLLLPSI
ncbi:MAG: hypothetical protein C5B58_08255 [Acidobacteria bacterium]|nr:MAG: hypothetical protein C5B58_08255 [Acidobacteriota bacterium]